MIELICFLFVIQIFKKSLEKRKIIIGKYRKNYRTLLIHRSFIANRRRIYYKAHMVYFVIGIKIFTISMLI